MHTTADHATPFADLSLRLPALARVRMHQTWSTPQPVSATQTAELWLADLDSPVRLSRWAQGFRTYDLGAFAPARLADLKDDVLAACDRTSGRVLMLAQPSLDDHSPRIFWVLDDDGAVVAHVAEVVIADERAGLFVTGDDATHVTGTLRVDGRNVVATGQLRAHLDASGVRVGLQLTSGDGTPLVTMSVTGTLASGSSRALIQSAQRLAASQRALAA